MYIKFLSQCQSKIFSTLQMMIIRGYYVIIRQSHKKFNDLEFADTLMIR